MRSRIFCLIDNNKSEEEKETIRENFEDLTEGELYEQMQCYGADYVNEDTDLKNDCDWLKECKCCNVYEKDGKYYVEFDLNTIKKRLAEKIEQIKARVDELSLDSISAYLLYEIQTLVEEKHGFWFLVDERWSDYTLDNLLTNIYIDYRDNRDYKLPLVYEIARTFDYHF